MVESADFVVVANRLPVTCADEDGRSVWQISPGGLVSALVPVLRERDGVWVGWSGVPDGSDAPRQFEGITLSSVSISSDEYESFYLGFANRTLWPLYHDAIRTPTFDRRWWQAYIDVNRRYANAAAEVAAPGAIVWVHDYHLQLVPMLLRERRPDVRIGFFLHIPFPPLELFMQLPWRRQILEGLLGADLIGFQVPDAASNFTHLARRLLGVAGRDGLLHHADRVVRVGAFPISIDTADLAGRATTPTVVARAREIRRELGDPELLMLGVDRLDYTKGIEQRVKAVAELFAEDTLTTPRHVMVQVAVPSREEDTHYRHEREQLERLIGEVNGAYSQVGHPAIHYLYQSVTLDELVALYLAADLMLVTPFRDGMNLIAKEYVACRADGTGALVLSEFAGAARELKDAILVNPHDLDSIKDAIRHVLTLDPIETIARMRRLRRVVRRRDIYEWARAFLAALPQSGDTSTGRRTH